MKKNTEPLQPDTYYHVYIRGINGETIFKTEKNYAYFLKKYAFHIEPIAATYAYCLLNNHFHLLIRTRSEQEILETLAPETLTRFKTSSTLDKTSSRLDKTSSTLEKSASFHISNQFAKLFNSYTQAINKAYDRTGGLFETPFRRKEVKSDAYFSQLIWYIHFNPQKHDFVKDFRDYKYSSYQSHIIPKATKLQREEVLGWFGGEKEYINFHSLQTSEDNIKDIIHSINVNLYCSSVLLYIVLFIKHSCNILSLYKYNSISISVIYNGSNAHFNNIIKIHLIILYIKTLSLFITLFIINL